MAYPLYDENGKFQKMAGRYPVDHCLGLGDIFHEEWDHSFIKASSGNTARDLNCRNKRQVAKKVYLRFLQIMLDDLIENGNVYLLPVAQGARIHITGKSNRFVTSVMRRGLYKLHDFFAHDFKIFEVVFDFYEGEKLRRRKVRINMSRFDVMREKVNKGEIMYDYGHGR